MPIVRRPLAWLSLFLALPAALFLAAAATRLLQPTAYQPARGAALAVGWVFALPHWATGLAFGVFPVVSLVGGLVCAWLEARSHPQLRSDLASCLAVARRHLSLLTAVVAISLSALVIMLFAVHAIAG